MDRFLEELTLLSKRFNIYITGCHHCGSPYLETIGEVRLAEKLSLDAEEGYWVGNYTRDRDVVEKMGGPGGE